MKFISNIIATIALFIVRRFFYFYGCYRSLKQGEFMQYQFDIALAKDAYGNALGKYYFNDHFGNGFGNRKETISSRIGKNKVTNTLKPEGKYWYEYLNKKEKNHCENAIDNIV
jgi:hypothetical protein